MTAPATDRAADWLELEHPEYTKLKQRWTYTRDHYTGDCLDPDRITKYLVQKALGESTEAYQERVRLADYTNFFGAVVDSLAGILWASDDKTNRSWNGEGSSFDFGDPSDRRTLAGRLFRDANGEGVPYITLWKGATVDLLLDHRIWVLADTAEVGGRTMPVLRLLPALSVPNWVVDRQGLAGVIVKETDDAPTALERPAEKRQGRIVYRRGGWERWEKTNDRAWAMTEGPTPYSYTNSAGGTALPIFRVDLPLTRHVGWLLAKKQNAIFNRESSRDNLINLANHPRLNIVADDTAFDKAVQSLRDGANALQVKPGEGNHNYISPDVAPATIASEVLKEKRQDFFTIALREYGDAARQRTATEVRQDVAQGVGAFLSLLASALDAAENGALWRLAQTERPGTDAAAIAARVERSEDFATVDPEAAIDKLRERVFGKDAPVPAGNTARVEAAKQILAYLGIESDEEEIREHVALQAATEQIKAYAGMPLSASIRVQMLKLLLTSTKLMGEESVTMADGTQATALAAALAEALELALAEDESSRRAGEVLGGGMLGAGAGSAPETEPALDTDRIEGGG